MIDWSAALYMGEAVYRSTTGNVDVRAINAAGTYAVWTSLTTVPSAVPFLFAENDLLTIDGTVLF